MSVVPLDVPIQNQSGHTAPPYIWLYHICLNTVPVFQDVSPAGGIQMFTYSVQMAVIGITLLCLIHWESWWR